jgi:hypothetical protein
VNRWNKALAAIHAAQSSGMLTEGELTEMHRAVVEVQNVMKLEKIAVRYCTRVRARLSRSKK